VVDKVKKLRDLSPLYEMAREGVDYKTIQWVAH
jgi:cysteine desulfurase